MGKFVDMTGYVFDRLTILKRAGSDAWGAATWLCICECGNEVVVAGADLRKRKTTSCGCYHVECVINMSATHGHSHTPLYEVYKDMKRRCNNKNRSDFQHYGGRGISVCDEWANDYMKFHNWALENGYAQGLEIDRINNDGDYAPNNCQFITHKQNCATDKRRIGKCK